MLFRKHLIAYQLTVSICIVLFAAQCNYSQGTSPEIAKERQAGSLSTSEVYPIPTLSTSMTPTIDQAGSNPTPTLPASRSMGLSQIPEYTLDPQVFASISPGYYLIYLYKKEVHVVSLDGSFDRMIGKEGDIRFIRYGKIVLFDKACNCNIYYELVNGILKAYGRVTGPDDPGCRSVTAPNLRWYGAICQDSSQLLIQDVKSAWSKVIEERTTGTDEAFYLPGLDWSSDSQWVAYFRTHTSAPPPGDSDLVLINVSCQVGDSNCSFDKFGSYKMQNQKIIAQGVSTWSYDSKSFAFVSMTASPIYVFNIDTKTFKTIDFGENYYIKQLYWLPDGQTFVFSQDFRIYTASISGEKPFIVVDKPVSEDDISLLGWISTYPKPKFRKGITLNISPAGDHLNLRSSPTVKSAILQQLSTGDQIQIIDGLVTADTFTWWKVRVMKNNQEGWVVENPDWYLPSKKATNP